MSQDKPRMDEGKKPFEPTEAPGDVAGLYSWAKLEGSEYRDFSASRDQARASRRQRERPIASKLGEPATVRGAVGAEKPAAPRKVAVAQMGPRRLTAVKKAPSLVQTKQPRALATPKRWAGLQSVFGQPGESRETGTQAPIAIDTPSLAFVSLAGGVGKTSLAAAISHALAAQGERILLVDTQPYGLLALIVGTDEPGITVMTPDPEQNDTAHGSENLLMDEVVRDADQADRILIDVASGSTAWLRQALRISSSILVVVTPDMASVASLQTLQAFFHSMEEETDQQLSLHYLLNQFDPSLRLHIDIQQALAEQLGDRLLPFCVHASPAMREALAEGTTVDVYAPDSETAEEIRDLAQWVRKLNQPAVELPNLRWRES